MYSLKSCKRSHEEFEFWLSTLSVKISQIKLIYINEGKLSLCHIPTDCEPLCLSVSHTNVPVILLHLLLLCYLYQHEISSLYNKMTSGGVNWAIGFTSGPSLHIISFTCLTYLDELKVKYWQITPRVTVCGPQIAVISLKGQRKKRFTNKLETESQQWSRLIHVTLLSLGLHADAWQGVLRRLFPWSRSPWKVLMWWVMRGWRASFRMSRHRPAFSQFLYSLSFRRSARSSSTILLHVRTETQQRLWTSSDKVPGLAPPCRCSRRHHIFLIICLLVQHETTRWRCLSVV